MLGASQYQFQFPYCIILIIHTRYLSCLLLSSDKNGNGEENATKFVSVTETSAVIRLRGQAKKQRKKQGRKERDHTDIQRREQTKSRKARGGEERKGKERKGKSLSNLSAPTP